MPKGTTDQLEGAVARCSAVLGSRRISSTPLIELDTAIGRVSSSTHYSDRPFSGARGWHKDSCNHLGVFGNPGCILSVEICEASLLEDTRWFEWILPCL